MTKRLLTLTAAALLLALCVSASAARQDGKPSTPEQRSRAVEIATLLENDPLHKDAKQQAGTLADFVKEAAANGCGRKSD